MSYCRFSDADIYLFSHIGGYTLCQMCNIAPKAKSIFTVGSNGFFKCDPCKHCHGEGCDKCMIFGDTKLYTIQEAIDHVKAHIANGDYVSDYVLEELYQELEPTNEVD